MGDRIGNFIARRVIASLWEMICGLPWMSIALAIAAALLALMFAAMILNRLKKYTFAMMALACLFAATSWWPRPAEVKVRPTPVAVVRPAVARPAWKPPDLSRFIPKLDFGRIGELLARLQDLLPDFSWLLADTKGQGVKGAPSEVVARPEEPVADRKKQARNAARLRNQKKLAEIDAWIAEGIRQSMLEYQQQEALRAEQFRRMATPPIPPRGPAPRAGRRR